MISAESGAAVSKPGLDAIPWLLFAGDGDTMLVRNEHHGTSFPASHCRFTR